jgi:hypothetical protein
MPYIVPVFSVFVYGSAREPAPTPQALQNRDNAYPKVRRGITPDSRNHLGIFLFSMIDRAIYRQAPFFRGLIYPFKYASINRAVSFS